jgi:Flp pilus assembly pilin Flp
MNKYQSNKIKGATMIEYALIVGLISIVAIVFLTPLGTKIAALFQSATTAIP